METSSAIIKTICRINRLKKEKDVVVLVHNYQPLAIQSVGDFVGDSLELAQQASKIGASTILMCGVRFMAETAKLLNPKAKVLLSHKDAGCPLADTITAEQLRTFKAEYPGAAVICYVNSSVEVKAESDICCTSSSAFRAVNSIPEGQQILFVPDQNLGSYVAQQLKREIILWKGYCNVHHHLITDEDVVRIRKDYPGYKLVVHPECRPSVVAKADLAASTKGIADYVAENDMVVIGTEYGMYEQLQCRYPEKKLVPLSKRAVCINMKKGTLKDVLSVLENETNEITIPSDIAAKALVSVERMLQVVAPSS